MTPACALQRVDRTHPQGVLARIAQTATTYNPPGLLEYGRIYYWRVDFVIPGPTPTIYKGPALKFTTAALAGPSKNVYVASTTDP